MDGLLEMYKEMGILDDYDLNELSDDSDLSECPECGENDYTSINNQFSELEILVCTKCNNEFKASLSDDELVGLFNNSEDNF